MQEHHKHKKRGGGRQLGQVPMHFMLKCFESLNAQILM
jgi:hypothetical protein